VVFFQKFQNKKRRLTRLFLFLEYSELMMTSSRRFLAEHALDEMKNNGHSPTLRETPQGHELNAENLKELCDFFNSWPQT